MNLAPLVLLLVQNPDNSLPDIHALLKDVRAHQLKLDEVRDNYTFHQTETIDSLDASDKVTKSTMTESEIFFVNGRRVARVVKREGKPLSEAEEKTESAEIAKRVGELSKKPRPTRGPGLLSQILAVAEVSNPRRTTVAGRSALAYDFKGDPKAPSHGLAQDALKKTAGTLWFDDAEHQILRAEIEFFENFRIAGGLLASVRKGSHVEIEQSPIGDGIWMQTGTSEHLGLRVVFKGVRQNVRTHSFDFRKFDVVTTQRISGPF